MLETGLPMLEREPSAPALGSTSLSVDARAFAGAGILGAVQQVREKVVLVRERQRGRLGVVLEKDLEGARADGHARLACARIASLPPVFPEWLGDRSFCEAHRARFPYAVGEMANGISTTRMVVAAARAGLVGFFGAAGLPLERIASAVAELGRELGEEAAWGSNLIHSPNEPALEEATAATYLQQGVRRVSASAFMSITRPVVRYAASGLCRDARGVRRRNHLFAKVSRPETARLFLSPAPREILDALVTAGQLTREEAELASGVPLAEDVTVEADSGGHTDSRPLTAIFPVIARLRDELTARHGYDRTIRLGAAGGLGTPSAVAAAFSLGASYVLTGSVNQSAVESGLGVEGRRMLARAGVADVMMAPSADMFELGVRVQVLRRETLFGPRAQRLQELYLSYGSLEAIPGTDRRRLEAELFRMPLQQVWEETRRFWAERDPRQNDRAAQDARHKMALCFRWYLGQSSAWAISGEADRRGDYQIWCGPAMGAFNAWARGSFLEEPDQRTVAQIGKNLLEGAAVVTRAQQLRSFGVPVPSAAFEFRPRPLA